MTNEPNFDIPNDTDIVLTHQPLEWKGLGNVLWGIDEPSKPLGCKVLTEAVMQTQAKYHFCGHIHTGNHERSRYLNGTIGVNVSMLDEGYGAHYKPFSCAIKNKKAVLPQGNRHNAGRVERSKTDN